MRCRSAIVPLLCIFVGLQVGLAFAKDGPTLRRVKRVINGQRMDKNEFPWLVSLKGRFWTKLYGFIPFPSVETCGASLIADRWLLSAAHCFQEKLNGKTVSLNKPSSWTAHLASKRRMPSMKDWLRHVIGKILRRKKWYIWREKIEKIIVHPQFSYNTGSNGNLHYDIALLKLKKPLPYQEHQSMAPVSLPTSAMSEADWPPTGINCTFAGWGCNKVGGSAVKFATKVNFRIVEDTRCLTTYSNKFVNLDNDMCAGAYNSNIGICPGDSGGPLICKKDGKPYQAGIASATAAEAPESYPGIFTRISTFRSWIINTMANN